MTADSALPKLPILDISQLAACPDYDSDCCSMSLEHVLGCMAHDNPRLTGICVEMQRRQTMKDNADVSITRLADRLDDSD